MDNAAQTSPPPSGRLTGDELDLTGKILADFHILRRLGQGGMGQVYLAEQLSLKRKVALKILRSELARDPVSLRRFQQEALSVAQATHANIVQVYAIGEADGIAYMALEYVEGRNLREYLQKKGPPELLLALSIMRQVASALQRAGELGIIHRDIKPENILLTRKNEVKVADFGLSRCCPGDRPALNLTQSGVTMGTPLYMSPEQVEGKTVDSRTDIYSLGVTCYHMLTGQPPFQGDSPFEVALQHVRIEAKPLAEVRPDLPPALSVIVHKMLAKEPAARYQTGRELLKDIARLRESLSGQTAATPSASAAPDAAPSADSADNSAPTLASPISQQTPEGRNETANRWRRWRVALFVVSMFAAAGAGAAWGWYRRRLAFPLPAPVAPATENDKTIPADKEEENALCVMVERYLHSPPNDRVDGQVGLGLCMKLGVFYLERHRLNDALTLFARLEKPPRRARYRHLGYTGRAIVLALQSHAKESNDLFSILCRPRAAGKPPFDLQWMWREKAWSYWASKALRYNRQNGVPLEEIPQPLHRLL